MSNKLCVYTCITGDYDDLKEINFPEKDIDYYCFTNNKNLTSKTWKIIQINDKLANRLLARKTKILGHPIIDKYDTAVWTDADVVWQTPISEFVKTYFNSTSFAIFKHHARNNIRDEAIACLTLRKDTKENILKILDFYETNGYPDNNGLCESTVFIKKVHDKQVIETTKIWYEMIENYTHRDQLSFNYAVWKTGLKVFYIDLNVWGNPWFSTAQHNPEPKIESCHVYYGNPDQNFDINKYYIYDYTKNNHTYSFSTTIPYTTKELVFYPASVIGIKYQDITISPKPQNIEIEGLTLSISCSTHNVFRAHGNFQKGAKLSFSFIIGAPKPTEISDLLKIQFNQNSKIIQNLQVENARLLSANEKLQKDLSKIVGSKGWRILEKFRKIIPHK